MKGVAVLLILSVGAWPLFADGGAPTAEALAPVPPSSATERDEAGFQASFAESFLAAEATDKRRIARQNGKPLRCRGPLLWSDV